MVRRVETKSVPICTAIGVLLIFGVSASAADKRGALVDPTQPFMGSRSQQPGGKPASGATNRYRLVLQSTLVSPNRKQAVINGKTYRVGDRIGRAVISEIRSYEVILREDGREKTLRLLPKLAKEQNVSHEERSNATKQ